MRTWIFEGGGNAITLQVYFSYLVVMTLLLLFYVLIAVEANVVALEDSTG